MLYIEEFYDNEELLEYYKEEQDTDLGIDTEATEGDVGF